MFLVQHRVLSSLLTINIKLVYTKDGRQIRKCESLFRLIGSISVTLWCHDIP